MAYFKGKLKSSGSKTTPCFRSFWIGKISDNCLPIQILLYVSFKNVLMSLTSFMGTPKYMGTLYNNLLLTESYFLEDYE
jgi:hypothetical protein